MTIAQDSIRPPREKVYGSNAGLHLGIQQNLPGRIVRLLGGHYANLLHEPLKPDLSGERVINQWNLSLRFRALPLGFEWPHGGSFSSKSDNLDRSTLPETVRLLNARKQAPKQKARDRSRAAFQR